MTGMTLFLVLTSDRAVAQSDADQALRERLTEREDQNRIEDPFTTILFGNTLTLSGQYEFNIEPIRRLGLGDPDGDFDRLLLEQEIETEVFYTFGEPLSLFVQFRLVMEEDLWSQVPDQLSNQYVERGEMWMASEDIAGSGIGLEIGRLDFEDDRRSWWDAELDAVRALFETDAAEIVVAVAREIAPDRTDRDFIDPEQDHVLRIFAEASWDWAENHAVEAFGLHHIDDSSTQRVGDRVTTEREDESDATLTWLGARSSGVIEADSIGLFGYWVEAAWVTGREKWLEFDEISSNKSEVVERLNRDVSGWALEFGATWIAPLDFEPRVTLGYALGSGERHPDSGDDRSFRQTQLHGNEPGFGGVQSFSRYGTLLDPELSNLYILTAGLGVSLFDASSLDFVYHYYRQFDPATALRDARLDPELTGRHRDLGHGVDIILALEQWRRVDLLIVGSFFRAGDAFGPDDGRWSYGAFGTLSIAY